MSYCNYKDVMQMSGASAKKLGFEESEFQEIVTEWIGQAENFINNYCHRKWNHNVPAGVKNVCIRLTANIIAFHYARRDDPLRKVNDYSTTIHSSEVFTEDLRQDLKPFRKPTKISAFTI